MVRHEATHNSQAWGPNFNSQNTWTKPDVDLASQCPYSKIGDRNRRILEHKCQLAWYRRSRGQGPWLRQGGSDLWPLMCTVAVHTCMSSWQTLVHVIYNTHIRGYRCLLPILMASVQSRDPSYRDPNYDTPRHTNNISKYTHIICLNFMYQECIAFNDYKNWIKFIKVTRPTKTVWPQGVIKAVITSTWGTEEEDLCEEEANLVYIYRNPVSN